MYKFALWPLAQINAKNNKLFLVYYNIFSKNRKRISLNRNLDFYIKLDAF